MNSKDNSNSLLLPVDWSTPTPRNIATQQTP